MSVSLIITTYNRPDALLRVLESVLLQTQLPDEVVIADDGSMDATKNCISEFNKSAPFLLIHSWQQDQDFRAAESRNKAIAKSTCEYIIMIDGDMILHHKFIEDHLFHAEPGYFIQGSRVFLDKKITNKILKTGLYFLSFFSLGLSNRKNAIYSVFFARFFLKKRNYIEGIKSCNMSFHKKDYIGINGFNNDLVGWGKEDTEFAVRLINYGINRKNIHFNSIQFHLWHEKSSRALLTKNDAILQNTINSKLDWCENGISKFL